jgi:LmbE family N-acetylglucosaminyl deacetylase
MWHPNKILAISPHADDIELGCGGTLHKWAEKGWIKSVIFSTLQLPRMDEIAESHKILGITDITVFDYANRVFGERRQEILEVLCAINKEYKPDCVLIPTSTDIHQDHQVIHNEALRAFKHTTILGYEDLWNMYSSNLRLHIKLTSDDIRAKCDSALAHKSQFNRIYMNKAFITGLAQTRGLAIGEDYAEAFEVIRWVA